MDKKSKVLFFVMFLAILVAICLSFYRYVIQRDYYLQIEVECDPAKEMCFTTVCDPVDDSTCPENESDRTSFYKIILKKARAVPDCDPNNSDCPAVSCYNDSECQEVFCNPDDYADVEMCSGPKTRLFE